MWCHLAGSVLLLVALSYSFLDAAEAQDCDVCISFLKQFGDTLTDADRKDKDVMEKKLKKYCKSMANKEERFCFFIGAREDSATSTIGDVIKPLSYYMPPEKICEKLNVKDSQICELKYEKKIDFSEVDFKKMKVKELKQILTQWGEDCSGCTEKAEFIARVERLLPQHAPEAAKARAGKAEL